MRTRKSILNFIAAFSSQFIIILLGFISRRVLIYNVGVGYLGINGLMTNLLTVFSLAESGIGLVIGYALYEPLSKNDFETIKSLMHFYKRAYEILAVLTAIIGLVFYPFLPIFLTGNTAPDTSIIYFLFLFSSVASYLFSYKVTLNNSDQNKYIFTVANTVSQIIVLILKIFVLSLTKNYIFFLIIDIVTTLLKNIIFSKIVDIKYPYIKDKNVVKLNDDIKKKLFKNIKALFLGKIGYIISQCSDNLVISSMINITSLGFYSNYTTIITSVSGFVKTFTSSITASMGNSIVNNNNEKNYSIFLDIDFINYWLYSFCSICLLCLTEPFIKLWLGEYYLLDFDILLFSILLFFIEGISLSVDMVKNATGLFYPDRYIPILQSVSNILISIILAKQIGIVGVLIGTLLSFLFFSFWIKPYLVYKYIFKIEFVKYFKMVMNKFLITFIAATCCYLCSLYINYKDSIVIDFMLKTIVVVVLANAILILLNYKNSHFQNVKNNFVKKVFNKFLNHKFNI